MMNGLLMTSTAASYHAPLQNDDILQVQKQEMNELRELKQKMETLKKKETALIEMGLTAEDEELKRVQLDLKRAKQEHEDLEFHIFEMLVSDDVEDEDKEEEDPITPTNVPTSTTFHPQLENATADSSPNSGSLPLTNHNETLDAVSHSPTKSDSRNPNTALLPSDTQYSPPPTVPILPQRSRSFKIEMVPSSPVSPTPESLLSDAVPVQTRSPAGLQPPSPLRSNNETKETSRPLTQYLPTMDPQFALDEYLLSLGHNLGQLRDTVLVDRHSCSGHLIRFSHKPSRLRFRPGKRCWVVFDRCTQTMRIMRRANSKKVKEAIPFHDIQDVFIDRFSPFASLQTTSSKRSHHGSGVSLVFCVQTVAKMWHFLAPDENSLRVWLQALFTGAQGYLASAGVTDSMARSAF